jgi:RNA polymerase sigma factor (sigma-70 family)
MSHGAASLLLHFRPIATFMARPLVPLCGSAGCGKNVPSTNQFNFSKKNMSSTEQFEAIVSEHYEPLFRFAMSLTHTEADACDLTQHTFYTWATKGHQLRDISKVKTWLYTTLHRAFLQARRRQVRFPHHDLEETSQQLPVLDPDFINQADCSVVLPALAKVDEIFRGAVALFYLEDCSYKEIAAILDVPIGTVKSRIARGIAQLREILLSDRPGDSLPRLAAAEDTRPLRRDAPSTNSERSYDEWDFSSTFVREHFACA